MRTVRYSKTALDQLNMLLAQGIPAFDSRVVSAKQDLVYDTVDQFLAAHPKTKRPHPTLKLRVYLISKTPFVVIYDFDDIELRVHFIVHRSADLSRLDPSSAEW